MKRVYSEDAIRDAVERIAEAISRDYAGQEVLLLGVLKGSFLFLADLVRQVQVPCRVDFVRLSSYGAGTSSAGTVEEKLSRSDPVFGRHVIVVEEIVDSGLTLARLLGQLRGEGPASLAVCALVDKTGRRETYVPVRYRGFAVEDGFLVGYGMDWNEQYRHLPAIWVLDHEELGAGGGPSV